MDARHSELRQLRSEDDKVPRWAMGILAVGVLLTVAWVSLVLWGVVELFVVVLT
jgi:hypothetical protein